MLSAANVWMLLWRSKRMAASAAPAQSQLSASLLMESWSGSGCSRASPPNLHLTSTKPSVTTLHHIPLQQHILVQTTSQTRFPAHLRAQTGSRSCQRSEGQRKQLPTLAPTGRSWWTLLQRDNKSHSVQTKQKGSKIKTRVSVLRQDGRHVSTAGFPQTNLHTTPVDELVRKHQTGPK